MEKIEKVPPVEPEYTYNLKGLTKEDLLLLRDLTGLFACNRGDGNYKQHFHTELYCKIETAIGHYKEDGGRMFTFRVNGGSTIQTIRCEKADPPRD